MNLRVTTPARVTLKTEREDLRNVTARKRIRAFGRHRVQQLSPFLWPIVPRAP